MTILERRRNIYTACSEFLSIFPTKGQIFSKKGFRSKEFGFLNDRHLSHYISLRKRLIFQGLIFGGKTVDIFVFQGFPSIPYIMSLSEGKCGKYGPCVALF